MGQGIGRIENIVVFVDGALPGDYVKAEIYEKKKKFYKAGVLEFIEKSPNRTTPECPYSKACGGCAYMELTYDAQLEFKEKHLKDKLQRIAGINDFECERIVPMETPYYYRNKTEFAISKDGKVGFNRMGTNQIIDISNCLISSPVANVLLPVIGIQIKTTSLGIRKVTIRTSFSTGETMVILHTNVTDIDKLALFIKNMDDAVNRMDVADNPMDDVVNRMGDADNLMDDAVDRMDAAGNPVYDTVEPMAASQSVICPSLESVYVYDETKKKNPYTLIAGKRTINDWMMNLKFEISPPSFYQVNPLQAVNLFEKVKEYVGTANEASILDLYCGVGSIGLTLADSAKEIIGVEVVKEAILDANRNAVINGIVNARYKTGKAEELMDELRISDDSVILLDPPRAGCKQEVLETIGKSKAKKIVYVSCDQATFARDVKILKDFGFDLEKIVAVDMFPQTTHVETVALISKVEK